MRPIGNLKRDLNLDINKVNYLYHGSNVFYFIHLKIILL